MKPRKVGGDWKKYFTAKQLYNMGDIRNPQTMESKGDEMVWKTFTEFQVMKPPAAIGRIQGLDVHAKPAPSVHIKGVVR